MMRRCAQRSLLTSACTTAMASAALTLNPRSVPHPLSAYISERWAHNAAPGWGYFLAFEKTPARSISPLGALSSVPRRAPAAAPQPAPQSRPHNQPPQPPSDDIPCAVVYPSRQRCPATLRSAATWRFVSSAPASRVAMASAQETATSDAKHGRRSPSHVSRMRLHVSQ